MKDATIDFNQAAADKGADMVCYEIFIRSAIAISADMNKAMQVLKETKNISVLVEKIVTHFKEDELDQIANAFITQGKNLLILGQAIQEADKHRSGTASVLWSGIFKEIAKSKRGHTRYELRKAWRKEMKNLIADDVEVP